VTNLYSNRLRVGLGLQQPTGYWTNGFGYDDAKRLTNVTSPAGAFGYSYDATRLRLPSGVALPNSSYITNFYDANARLLSTTLYNSSGTALDGATYGYNAANQRTNFANAAGTNVLYTYDNIGQLTVATSSVSAENRGYKYDAAWNLNDRTNNGVNTAFSVDVKNQLTTVGITNFLYDSNGNMTNWSWTSGAHGGSTTNFYDVENRLIAVQTLSNSVPIQTTFVYDGLSRLRQQLWWTNSTGGGSGGGVPPPTGGSTNWTLVGGIEYIYDGNRVIQERDYNNNPLVSYTRGNDLSGSMEGAGGIGGLLARSDGYSSGNFTDHNFYHADGNGNITYLVNSSQTLAASYRYDPFGNLLTSSGSLAVSNMYRFSSKEFIPSVGLYYYVYRFYNPTLQRWLNPDPLIEAGFRILKRNHQQGKINIKRFPVDFYGGALNNLYRFSVNNPISRVDFLGLNPGSLTWLGWLEQELENGFELVEPVVEAPVVIIVVVLTPSTCGENEDEEVIKRKDRWYQDLEDECADVAAAQMAKMYGADPANWDYQEFLDLVEDCMIDKGWTPAPRD
jgi:RHS repeat-associated protein